MTYKRKNYKIHLLFSLKAFPACKISTNVLILSKGLLDDKLQPVKKNDEIQQVKLNNINFKMGGQPSYYIHHNGT